MTTYTLDPEITFVETKKINKYSYGLTNFKPHTSVEYYIFFYYDTTLIKQISGILEGQEYLDWTNDDYLDTFIKRKISEHFATI